MKKEFDLKIDGGTLESIKIDSSNSLIIATYTRDVAEFKAGDIIVDDLGPVSSGAISIFKCISEENDNLFDIYAFFDADWDRAEGFDQPEWDYITDQRLATEQEKQLLFDALKKEGLRWNAEKLEIEKLVSEFKRGDILASKSGDTVLIFDKYTPFGDFDSIINNSNVASDNNWNLEKFRHASIKDIEVFYKYLTHMGKKWNADKLEIEELDISDIVVDYKSAIKYLGIKDTLLVPLFCSPQSQDRADKFNAQIKLQIIAEAWNKFDEFEADWDDSFQKKFFTTFSLDKGELQIDYVGDTSLLFDSQSVNFSFKSEERAKQFGNQFIDLFKVALGV